MFKHRCTACKSKGIPLLHIIYPISFCCIQLPRLLDTPPQYPAIYQSKSHALSPNLQLCTSSLPTAHEIVRVQIEPFPEQALVFTEQIF